MNIGILGTKLGMTQIFDASGLRTPVTIIKAGPCTVTQVKSLKNDGYNAIQIGYLETQPKLLTKAELGHLAKTTSLPFKHLKEYKTDTCQPELLKSVISVDLFKVGDTVSISGKTIGKGFAGTVKKHKFTRGPMTHGSKNHREPGSIGMGTTPGRVYPGKRMACQMGSGKTTIKNLSVILVDKEDNLLVIKGSIPGKVGNLVTINKVKNIKNNAIT